MLYIGSRELILLESGTLVFIFKIFMFYNQDSIPRGQKDTAGDTAVLQEILHAVLKRYRRYCRAAVDTAAFHAILQRCRQYCSPACDTAAMQAILQPCRQLFISINL